MQERLRGQAAATLRGLARLAAAKMPVRVTAVLTRENALQLPALALTLAAFENVTGFGLDVLVRKGRAGQGDALQPEETMVVSGVRTLLATLNELARSRRAPLRWRELDAVREALAAPPAPRPYCHACRGESLAIHPDGAAYPCAQTVGDAAMAVGSVAQVDWARLRAIYQGRAVARRLRGMSFARSLSRRLSFTPGL